MLQGGGVINSKRLYWKRTFSKYLTELKIHKFKLRNIRLSSKFKVMSRKSRRWRNSVLNQVHFSSFFTKDLKMKVSIFSSLRGIVYLWGRRGRRSALPKRDFLAYKKSYIEVKIYRFWRAVDFINCSLYLHSLTRISTPLHAVLACVRFCQNTHTESQFPGRSQCLGSSTWGRDKSECRKNSVPHPESLQHFLCRVCLSYIMLILYYTLISSPQHAVCLFNFVHFYC